MKKVFVLGGTGFLGYHAILELIDCGYQVSTVSLPPLPEEGLLPSEVECLLGDINEMGDKEVVDLLKGCYAVIYAAGADERIVPPEPAHKFFYEANVLPTQRLARLAVKAKIEKFVVYNSYFAEFTERLPEYELRKQAYPNTRLLQEQVAFYEGEGAMTVTSIRLPYIFGTMPGRMPLWKMFTDQIKGQEVFPALKGGTAMVTARQVAQATVGAIENGIHRKTYAICGDNMKYQEFYQMMADALQQPNTQIPVLEYEQLKPTYEAIDKHAHDNGTEHGIHMVVSAKLQTEDLYLDPHDTMEVLGIEPEDIRAVIKETLKKCVEE